MKARDVITQSTSTWQAAAATQHPPTARARHVTLVNIDLHVLHDPYNTHKFGGETPRATSLPTHYLLDTTTFMDR